MCRWIKAKSRSVDAGQGLPKARQILTTAQVGLAQKEEVVELAPFAPCRIALVFAQLMVAQALESFALLARLLIDPLLPVP